MKSEKVVFFLFVFLFCLFFSSHQSNEYQLYPQQLTSQSLCEILLIMSSLQVACTGCLRKKYGVADYEYFKNDKTQQCKISDIINATFFQLFVKFQLHILYIKKVKNLRRMMDQLGLSLYQTTNLHTSVFYHPPPF